MLEAAGLGEERLLLEIEKRLRAKISRFHLDTPLGERPDNAVRQRATELLADLLGKRKAELTLHHDIVEVIPAPRPDDQPVDDD